MIGVISNERMEAKVSLYGRMLPKAGEFFCYRPVAVAEMVETEALRVWRDASVACASTPISGRARKSRPDLAR